MRKHTRLLLIVVIIGLVASKVLQLQNECVKQRHFLRWNLPKHYPCPVQVVDKNEFEPAKSVDVLEDPWDHPKLMMKTMEEMANVLNILFLQENTSAFTNVANMKTPSSMMMNDQIQKKPNKIKNNKKDNDLILPSKALEMTWYNRML